MEQLYGIKLHVVAFGDEYSTQQENQHFHSLCLEDSVTLSFELLKQVQQKFRIRDAQVTHKVSNDKLLIIIIIIIIALLL